MVMYEHAKSKKYLSMDQIEKCDTLFKKIIFNIDMINRRVVGTYGHEMDSYFFTIYTNDSKLRILELCVSLTSFISQNA